MHGGGFYIATKKICRRTLNAILKTSIGSKLLCDQRYRVIFLATLSLILNLLYAAYHGVLGVLGRSWWFSALWAYYTILGITRFSAVLCERRSHGAPSIDTEYFVMRVVGILALLLGCVLAGVNYLSLQENFAAQYGEITMITIATYTFAKLTMAVVRRIKYRKDPSPLLAAIRRIGYAEVAVSVLTMQRSMLVSFGHMAATSIRLMNALTGTGVFLFISVLGIGTIKDSFRRSQ